MAPPRKSVLPKALPEGFVLTDTEKKAWRLGRRIGQGGCGLIYLASQNTGSPTSEDTDFVIKVEYHQNGPLFSELKFYQRAAKAESMLKWKRSRKLDFLGIPTYWGSGLAEWNDLRYRFMVMDRLGSDLQKVCDGNKGRLKKATVLLLGQKLVEVLEYIHENEYVHADIKAANLMMGHRDPEQVYLADYGLSYRYCPDGVHKEYKENPKKGHNGTIEYTSIDAHKGLAPSRRGDLQILGFCLLHWLCGSLPWEDVLRDPIKVQEAKTRLMENLPESVQQLSTSGASTGEVAAFLLYVKTLDYQDKPDYQHLRGLLGSSVGGRLDLSMPQGAAGEASAWDACSREKKPGGTRGAHRSRPGPPEGSDVPHGGAKSRPVPAEFMRGPPLTKPQQKEEDVPAVRRSRRTRAAPVSSSEGGDSEEEKTRPTPIAACYLRGPPMKPGGVSKKTANPTRTSRNTDGWAATARRQEPRLHHPERRHVLADVGLERRRLLMESERQLEEELRRYGEACDRRRHSSGKSERWVPTLASWFFLVAFFLVLVAALSANQKEI